MIDINEPARIEYGPEEKENLLYKFLILLHSLLLVYLGLHCLIIPLIQNLYFSRPLLNNLSYWFLFQIPVQYFLRRHSGLPRGYFHFLVLGSSSHLLYSFMSMDNLKSWSFLSLLISELAALIFYSIYYSNKGKDESFSPMALWGLIIPAILGSMEIHTSSITRSRVVPEKKAHTSKKLGCMGSDYGLTFPSPKLPQTVEKLMIKPCGLDKNAVVYQKNLIVTNSSGKARNLRLYVLKVLHGRISWKFLRLVRLKENEAWDLTTDLKAGNIFVLKSPEHRELGSTILLPEGLRTFLLGKGRMSFKYDSLEWVQDG